MNNKTLNLPNKGLKLQKFESLKINISESKKIKGGIIIVSDMTEI